MKLEAFASDNRFIVWPLLQHLILIQHGNIVCRMPFYRMPKRQSICKALLHTAIKHLRVTGSCLVSHLGHTCFCLHCLILAHTGSRLSESLDKKIQMRTSLSTLMWYCHSNHLMEDIVQRIIERHGVYIGVQNLRDKRRWVKMSLDKSF